MLLNRNQRRCRERERWGEGGREGGREELLLPNYSDWAGSALFTNRTRFSNPGSPNLTSKHRGTPDWETGRARERERERVTKKKQQHTKKLCVIILASVHTPSPPPSSNSTSTPACRIIWTICFFFLVFSWRRDIHRKKESSSCPTHAVVSSFCPFSSAEEVI